MRACTQYGGPVPPCFALPGHSPHRTAWRVRAGTDADADAADEDDDGHHLAQPAPTPSLAASIESLLDSAAADAAAKARLPLPGGAPLNTPHEFVSRVCAAVAKHGTGGRGDTEAPVPDGGEC
jgi:hypothetical protein